ncbi:MAG: CDP-6-deoxy-delta-3,4-glucoseen reductase [Gammaproteobacteria bacterium]|nr:CDP-6-deoxy-delta-3,4-glucoseen reductase [Gammaproteobacteria bacterium]
MKYRVNLQPSYHTLDVDENESILSAALREGIHLAYGCRSGTCGTCKSVLLEGKVAYPVEQALALTDEERQHGAALLCQAQPRSDLTIAAQVIPHDDVIVVKKLPCRVSQKQLVCHDVLRLLLKLPVMEKFSYRAGQYIDILLPDGRRRSFSLANAPFVNGSLELHVRHVEGGDFTGYVFKELEEKTILRVEGPHGQFFLREDSDRPIIFMAGGTGFAPIKSIIEFCIINDIQRPMYLYWGARAQQDLYMNDLAALWAKDFPHIHYIPVLSAPKPQDDKSIRTGLVHEAITKDFPDLSGYEVYASGPPMMVKAGKEAFARCHLPPEHYYSDAFEFQRPK